MTHEEMQSARYTLSGKVAIVCGAGAPGDGIGNGRAAAMLLADSGAAVVCVDRDAESAANTAGMISACGGEGISIAADVTSEVGCQAVVEKTMQTYGRIDLLDNNVGVGSRGSIVDDTPENWNRVLKINIDSIYWMSRCVIPKMALNEGGAIVNVSSISALRPRGLTAYSTSKGAVIAMTRAMAVDHAAQGIRVNCVAPGPVYTPRIEIQGLSDARRASRVNAAPLQTEGTGWDVGHAVAFLLSDAAKYVTGQTLVVDGGVTLRGPDR